MYSWRTEDDNLTKFAKGSTTYFVFGLLLSTDWSTADLQKKQMFRAISIELSRLFEDVQKFSAGNLDYLNDNADKFLVMWSAMLAGWNSHLLSEWRWRAIHHMAATLKTDLTSGECEIKRKWMNEFSSTIKLIADKLRPLTNIHPPAFCPSVRTSLNPEL